MSQAGVLNLAAGPVPPTVATQYTTDDATIAIPAANNLNVFSRNTTANNTNGIDTTADPNLSANLYIQLTNRISVTGTTVGAVTTTVTLFTPTNGTSITYTGVITARETTTADSAGGGIMGLAKKTGGVVTVVGDSDLLDENDPALDATVDWNIVASGANLVVQFIGVAATTLNWRCTFTYQQVS